MTEALNAPTLELLGTPAWLWLAFLGVVTALLALDLGVLHRGERPVSPRQSLWLSAGYISIGLAFGAFVWLQLGPQPGLEYLTGFVIHCEIIEESLVA